MSRLIVWLSAQLYVRVLRPYLFWCFSAQQAHDALLKLLAWADNNALALKIASSIGTITRQKHAITVGGVTLTYPVMVAAGFVKGRGFEGEAQALQAVENGENIIAGWRCVPLLLGIVEFGSFTRHPRVGNSGEVIWRDPQTHSTQNRVGLKNAGAIASAQFLAHHKNHLPPIFGINLAVSPATPTPEQEQQDILESLTAFISRGVIPTWFTLNISCPNTEDDPSGNQTETKTRALCQAVHDYLQSHALNVPLWVKISPDLAPQQYAILMRVFAQTGVKAVIATNTLAQPSPTNSQVNAGVGGGKLRPHTLQAVACLQQARKDQQAPVDIIGCGGVINGQDFRTFQKHGVSVVQIWSALVYRGFLAPQIIESES
jgi:dihydroorotate dehydrogenase